MAMPSALGILLPTSANDLVTDEQAGPSGYLPGNKKKRSLNMANAENTEDRPKEKRVRKRRSNTHLTPEEAEERRKRVNKQERLRQKQNSEATDRLRRLNLPNNPNLPNHKKGSSVYVYSTVSSWIEALEQKCLDNSIDPRKLKLPDLPQEHASDESESDDPGVESGPINSVYSGPPQPLCGYKQESRGEPSTSRVYQNISTKVPQCGNKLPELNIHHKYSYGNTYPQYPKSNTIDLVTRKPQTQPPMNLGYQTVPGLHNGSKRFMTPNSFDPQVACSKVQHPEPSKTGDMNGYKNITGSNDITVESLHVPMKSPVQAITPTFISRFLGSKLDPAGQSLATVPSPHGYSGQLQVLSHPGHSGQLQVLSHPGHSGQLQVLSHPGHSGQLQVLSHPGHSGQLQALSPPGHSGQLQVLSHPAWSLWTVTCTVTSWSFWTITSSVTFWSLWTVTSTVTS